MVDDDGGGDVGPFDKRLTRSKLDRLYGENDDKRVAALFDSYPNQSSQDEGKEKF